jgi:predicted RNase H-like nuclease (RuvC/YqgF family)
MKTYITTSPNLSSFSLDEKMALLDLQKYFIEEVFTSKALKDYYRKLKKTRRAHHDHLYSLVDEDEKKAYQDLMRKYGSFIIIIGIISDIRGRTELIKDYERTKNNLVDEIGDNESAQGHIQDQIDVAEYELLYEDWRESNWTLEECTNRINTLKDEMKDLEEEQERLAARWKANEKSIRIATFNM